MCLVAGWCCVDARVGLWSHRLKGLSYAVRYSKGFEDNSY